MRVVGAMGVTPPAPPPPISAMTKAASLEKPHAPHIPSLRTLLAQPSAPRTPPPLPSPPTMIAKYTDGVKLGEGIVIADEDTTIYNPGLSLLTSSEKQRLVSAIVDNRAAGLTASPPGSGWSEENEYAFGYLKQKLDPLHMHELGGYLGILPYYGAVLYLAALAVQKNARELFPLAYGLCALGVFGPVLVLVAFGP